jgi:hypothetical protein
MARGNAFQPGRKPSKFFIVSDLSGNTGRIAID